MHVVRFCLGSSSISSTVNRHIFQLNHTMHILRMRIEYIHVYYV